MARWRMVGWWSRHRLTPAQSPRPLSGQGHEKPHRHPQILDTRTDQWALDTKSWAPTTKTPAESCALIKPPPFWRPLILDAKTRDTSLRKYDWPILCTVPFCSGHFLFSSQCLDFDVTLKDRFPGARLLWRRKIADCDKLDGGVISGGFCACVMYLCLDLLEVSYLYVRGGVISGGRLPCYVFSSWMYTEVSSVLVTRPVITLYSLLYWIEILCNKVDIESTGVGNPLHALLILSRENLATHSFPNCTVSSALLVFFIFAALPIICFNTGDWYIWKS